MSKPRLEVGDRIRGARQERRLSLNEVASRAAISVATLSRIETSKQSVDVDLLMTLARILAVRPEQLLGAANDDGQDIGALTDRLAALRTSDRVQLMRAASRRHPQKDLGAVVEDLLSTLDIMRDELEQVVRTARKSRKR